jgi:site-specific DNA-methyltransferase (adenine-specific)
LFYVESLCYSRDVYTIQNTNIMSVPVFNKAGIWTPSDIVESGIENSQVCSTRLGALFGGDCLELLPFVRTEAINTVFADPPFNLSKEYGAKVNDDRPDNDYISWCRQWLDHCIRVVKPGGAIFVYGLPRWNIILGNYLTESGLTFRHWIAVNIKLSLPIPGRLYPSHYSLLYFTKGKLKTFRKIRTPIEVCRHCGREIKDYGGYRRAMNPNGVNLTDIWNDITPVRHWKFKSRKRTANQLSTKLLERVVQMSTQECDVVLDPFGGSGTTYDVCERLNRHWIGIELESCDVIIERLQTENLSPHKSEDFIEG